MIMAIIDNMTCLQDINNTKDIKEMSPAIYPGMHCPLYGVGLVTPYIKEFAVLVVGTAECTYYSKSRLFKSNPEYAFTNVCNYVMEDSDVVFGCEKKIKDAVVKTYEQTGCKFIFLVTTCVPELTGEYYQNIISQVHKEFGITVLLVKLNRFNGESHTEGMIEVLSSLAEIMEPVKKNNTKKTVNILGYRFDSFEESELASILSSNDILVNAVVPQICTVSSIKNAAGADINIVTDVMALKLAKQMKKLFGTEYIYFGKYLNPEYTKSSYEKLFSLLDLPLPDEVEEKYKVILEKIEGVKDRFKSKKVIYSGSITLPFDTCLFLHRLGFEIQVIKLRTIFEPDFEFLNKLKETGINPYVCKSANMNFMDEIYEHIKPDIVVGHDYPDRLEKYNIRMVLLNNASEELGFSIIERSIDDLISDGGDL